MLKHARGRASRAATRDPAFVSPTGRPALASFDVLTGGQRPGQGVSELIDFRHVQLVRQRQYQRRTHGLSRACMRSARAARLKLCRLHRTCAVRMRGLGYVPIARRAVGYEIDRTLGRPLGHAHDDAQAGPPPSRVVIATSRSEAGSETPLSSDRSRDSSKLSRPRRLSTIHAEGSNVSATHSVPDLFIARRDSAKIFTKAAPRCGAGVRQVVPKKSAPPANTTVSVEAPTGTGAGGRPGVSERRAGVRTDPGGMQVPRHTSERL